MNGWIKCFYPESLKCIIPVIILWRCPSVRKREPCRKGAYIVDFQKLLSSLNSVIMSEIYSAVEIYDIYFKMSILAWQFACFWGQLVFHEVIVIRCQFCFRHHLRKCNDDGTPSWSSHIIVLLTLCLHSCTIDSLQWKQQKPPKKQKWLQPNICMLQTPHL